jgi:hypothetical protein
MHLHARKVNEVEHVESVKYAVVSATV